MTETPESESINGTQNSEQICAALLDAALVHVVFSGWSDATFAAAVAQSGVDAQLALQACPRKGVDLAVAFHRAGDSAMVAAIRAANLDEMRYSQRVGFAIRTRLEATEREAVRRGAALFALPGHAAEGALLIWRTVSLIWETLGDTSRDVNWYTKRATLSGVYSSTLLYWLGDESDLFTDTWAFLDRRIEDVMKIEMAKAKLRETPLAKAFMAGPGRLLDRIRAPSQNSAKNSPKKPSKTLRVDLPGYVAHRR